jgi:NAD(P)-dependent dehydrogenase (short-subunit alcohol dehydrogenase family)
VKLQDKVVVITGSGGGIGEACARRFTAEGAKVVVADRDGEGVARVAGAIGSVGLAVDLREEDNVRAVADLARRTYGDIDVWFSNAGVTGPDQPGDLQANGLWETTWKLHVMSHVHAVREVLPSMLERGDGYLLQTASVVALATLPGKAAYAVTKHAALALAEWLAVNYRPRGVKVSCFCPGPMRTPMLLSEGYPPDHPIMQAAATPEDVADRLVQAIDAEQFLVVDSTLGTDSLAGKATDYDGWISAIAELSASMGSAVK